MKKTITSLFSSFAIVISAMPLMANQVSSQEIENMKTKVDFWIDKTKNWENYLDKEFPFTYYSAPTFHFFYENSLDPNNCDYSRILKYLDNYTTNPNPTKPGNYKKWFDCELTYYPYKAVDLHCTVRSWTHNYLIKDFKMDDYPILTEDESEDLYLKAVNNQIIVRTVLNNGELGMKILFIYPTGCDSTNKNNFYNKQAYYHLASNHSASNKINIEISGVLIYRIREARIQKLHNKLLLIKQQLNDPNLAQDAYKTHLPFMNLEN